MKKLSLLFGFAVMILLAPGVLGIGGCPGGYSPSCINSTYLRCEKIHEYPGGTWPDAYNVSCGSAGCNQEARRCNDPYELEGGRYEMSMILYLIVFVIALGSLITGYRSKKLLLNMLAIILFLVLAFQSFAFDAIFMNTPFSSLTLIFVMLSWLFVVIALLSALIGMLSIYREKGKSKWGQ